MAQYDLIGQKFGRLTVLEKIGVINKSGCIYWKCLCECGKITKAHTSYLTNGRKASCGCIRIEKSRASIQKLIGWSKLPEGEAAFNAYYHQYKGGADRRNIDFILTKKEFFNITQKNCTYCNELPNDPHCRYKADGKSLSNGPYISNGIDRIDSKKGYVHYNIVPCCRKCNIMKQELSLEDFIVHIERLHANIKNIKEIK